MSPFDRSKRLLVVGDIFIDHHLDKGLVRLGGVFHAARTLHAIGVPYAIAHISPTYLDPSIEKFTGELKAELSERIGEVRGCPSVMLLRDSVEAGDQGYDEILRDQRAIIWNADRLNAILDRFKPTDLLLFPGKYPQAEVFSVAASRDIRLHVDVQYARDINELTGGGRPHFTTVFCSTSAPLFRDLANGSPSTLRDLLIPDYANTLILKENRGGSRVYSKDGAGAEAPAFLGHTAHSVGVGDCFDSIWILAHEDESLSRRLHRSSYYASMYASTMSHGNFTNEVQGAISVDAEIPNLQGLRLPWEKRRDIHIYIAAPDFPGVNTRPLDGLEDALRYHNFTPHRPVKEFGLHSKETSPQEASDLYSSDVELLSRCQILIAVPLYEDPGTFVEMGMFLSKGRPAILFDPGSRVENMFTLHAATRVCRTLGDTIRATFEILGNHS